MAEKTYMYVGCFTEPERAGTGSGGIVVFEKTGDGPWKRIQTVEQRNPSFLAMSEDKNFLYNVQGGGDKLCAYAINERTGKLSFLNSVPSKAGLALEVCNGYLFVAAGDISVYPLKEDGSIENEVARLTPTGEIGPMKGIQHSAQPHHILHDAQKKFFAVPCRGMDVVHIYNFDAPSRTVRAVSKLDTYGGLYPRHIAFHPQMPVAYVLLERYGFVLSCRYENGAIIPFESHVTVDRDFVNLYNGAAEIQIHPNGRILGISNRGHNSIALFSIREDGGLEHRSWIRERICVPRYFAFDASGVYVLSCNMGEIPAGRMLMKEKQAVPGTGTITLYRLDTERVSATFTGESIPIAAPACLLMKTQE